MVADQGSLHRPVLPCGNLLCRKTVLGPDTVLVGLDGDGGCHRAWLCPIAEVRFQSWRGSPHTSRMGKLRPEKGKDLFKAPRELVAASRLELKFLIPSLGWAQALPLSECSFLVS